MPDPARSATEWPAFDVERTSVRVVLLDAADRLLLFDTIDAATPATGRWWELPGGGMEPGESLGRTAARELAEEAGFVLAADGFTATSGSWRRSVTYLRRGRRTLQHEVVLAARLPDLAPQPQASGRTPEELQDYVGHRWWDLGRLSAAAAEGTRFFPGTLPELLPRFLAGEAIREEFEHWN